MADGWRKARHDACKRPGLAGSSRTRMLLGWSPTSNWLRTYTCSVIPKSISTAGAALVDHAVARDRFSAAVGGCSRASAGRERRCLVAAEAGKSDDIAAVGGHLVIGVAQAA